MTSLIVWHKTATTILAKSSPTSRVEKLDYLAVGNPLSDLRRQQLTKIGTTKAYKDRKEYLGEIKRRADVSKSKEKLIDKIISADHNENNETYEGGCQFLLQWYSSITSASTGNITE